MKHFLVFVLLFPLFCFLFLGVIVGRPALSEIPALVMVAYLVLTIPALLIAVIDRLLRRVWAVVVCAFVGFVCLAGSMYLLPHGPRGPGNMLPLGGIGALSAVACWLIARMTSARPQA